MPRRLRTGGVPNRNEITTWTRATDGSGPKEQRNQGNEKVEKVECGTGLTP